MLDLFFDKNFYNFDRMVRDSYPYKVKYVDDNHTILVHNVLGLNEDDISITTDMTEDGYTYIYIRGETKDEIFDTKYSVNSRFSISNRNIDKIEYTIKNGLLYLNIYYKKVDRPAIPINKVSVSRA